MASLDHVPTPAPMTVSREREHGFSSPGLMGSFGREDRRAPRSHGVCGRATSKRHTCSLRALVGGRVRPPGSVCTHWPWDKPQTPPPVHSPPGSVLCPCVEWLPLGDACKLGVGRWPLEPAGAAVAQLGTQVPDRKARCPPLSPASLPHRTVWPLAGRTIFVVMQPSPLLVPMLPAYRRPSVPSRSTGSEIGRRQALWWGKSTGRADSWGRSLSGQAERRER